jgi:hypothetical protein
MHGCEHSDSNLLNPSLLCGPSQALPASVSPSVVGS